MDPIERRPPQRWMVARTLARHEKQLLTWCRQLHITAYLPLRRSVRRYKRSTATHEVPVFPGYLFVQMEPIHKGRIEESRHAANVLIPDGIMEEQLVEELRSLQIMQTATATGDLLVRPEIAVGKSITIATGSLAGVCGTVFRRKGQDRLAINVEMIGQSVSIELDVGEVEIE